MDHNGGLVAYVDVDGKFKVNFKNCSLAVDLGSKAVENEEKVVVLPRKE